MRKYLAIFIVTILVCVAITAAFMGCFKRKAPETVIASSRAKIVFIEKDRYCPSSKMAVTSTAITVPCTTVAWSFEDIHDPQFIYLSPSSTDAEIVDAVKKDSEGKREIVKTQEQKRVELEAMKDRLNDNLK